MTTISPIAESTSAAASKYNLVTDALNGSLPKYTYGSPADLQPYVDKFFGDLEHKIIDDHSLLRIINEATRKLAFNLGTQADMSASFREGVVSVSAITDLCSILYLAARYYDSLERKFFNEATSDYLKIELEKFLSGSRPDANNYNIRELVSNIAQRTIRLGADRFNKEDKSKSSHELIINFINYAQLFEKSIEPNSSIGVIADMLKKLADELRNQGEGASQITKGNLALSYQLLANHLSKTPASYADIREDCKLYSNILNIFIYDNNRLISLAKDMEKHLPKVVSTPTMEKPYSGPHEKYFILDAGEESIDTQANRGAFSKLKGIAVKTINGLISGLEWLDRALDIPPLYGRQLTPSYVAFGTIPSVPNYSIKALWDQMK